MCLFPRIHINDFRVPTNGALEDLPGVMVLSQDLMAIVLYNLLFIFKFDLCYLQGLRIFRIEAAYKPSQANDF